MDTQQLAQQLSHPDGQEGVEVGEMMSKFNAPKNMWTVDLLNLQPIDHVLEVGFGPGETLAEVLRLTKDGFVAGIDYSQTMFEVASRRNQEALIQDRLELTVAEASSIPYPDETFDKGLAVNVLYFWKDPLIPLTEICRVMKRSGIFALCFTDKKSWLPGIAETGVFNAYTSNQASTYLRESGFSKVIMHEKLFDDRLMYCALAEK